MRYANFYWYLYFKDGICKFCDFKKSLNDEDNIKHLYSKHKKILFDECKDKCPECGSDQKGLRNDITFALFQDNGLGKSYCNNSWYNNFEINIKKENKAALHEPDPIKTEKSIKVLDLVEKDLKDRAEQGNKKYDTYLLTHNGRNSLMDAYQEALDLVMYLRQAIYEKENG
ncbi:MAG: hypothetical protein PHF86_08500 [Candidatus Nanoarchaeia archaeon]|nr:hypothetical protein [Candidatus Nanoarchaeia archaeon]